MLNYFISVHYGLYQTSVVLYKFSIACDKKFEKKNSRGWQWSSMIETGSLIKCWKNACFSEKIKHFTAHIAVS